ncbi:hypothetical protein PHMEG_00012721 [Phytophthora megakarya]|uniref:Uncharacterized protein n=1 Tax=Phytophthora megakarya TaxID=4795 RepID=A0A225W8I9_9STRA|nr:hypothetical protein PHMEG_00012721 [Phytophthora megakarya]
MSSTKVAGVSFFHLECSHAQLFHPEYKRSNRTKGLKILRCFPHCCPEHIDRSYCGTSLSVRVAFASDASPPDSSLVALFARFEAISDVSLQPGECVQVDKIDAATQSELNPEGPWMGGMLDKPSRLVVSMQTTETVDDDKPLVFDLNSRSYAKWYYDWESGANKAQRLMKHVLKAYVVERCAVDEGNNFVAYDSTLATKKLYRVLHAEASPEFTVISYRRAPSEQYQGIPDLLEDQLRWEYKNTATVSVSRNLSLVYSFLRWAPLSVYASFVDELTLLRVLADATLWFFSTDTRQWMRAFFRQYAGMVLDKHALRECFVLFIQELQSRLDTQIFAQTSLVNLANAAEEVIATVYSYEYFHARRPRVRKILSGQSFAGWNTFVAQMRETYISMSSCPGVPRTLVKNQSGLDFEQAHLPQNSVESDWNGEWLLDVDEAVWKPIISQLVRIEVGIDVQARTLHARSTQGIAGALDCMRLVLDGKDRVFSQFPNGMATGNDVGICGDYIGEMEVEESERLLIYLQVFNWSVRTDGPSYHTRMRIECWHSRELCISGDILATTAPVSFTPEEALYVDEMSLKSKREEVDTAYARQLEDNPVAGWAAVSGPWKELGRFRLSYVKV